MDKTLDMARETGVAVWHRDLKKWQVDQNLKDFEALVRADEREIVMNEPLTKAQWQRFEDEIRADERGRMCEQLKECSSEKPTSNEANRSEVLGEGG
jgi:predicted metallo-beta-lactamase superfamily hydrolase